MASLLTPIHSRELDSVMWTFNLHLACAIVKCMCMCLYLSGCGYIPRICLHVRVYFLPCMSGSGYNLFHAHNTQTYTFTHTHTQFDAGSLQRSVIMRFTDIESKRKVLGKHVIEECTIELVVS